LIKKLADQREELRLWEKIADGEVEIVVDDMKDVEVITRVAMDNIIEMHKKIAQTKRETDS
jgi:hypothetical protein